MGVTVNESFFKKFDNRVKNFQKNFIRTSSAKCESVIKDEIKKQNPKDEANFDVSKKIEKDKFTIVIEQKPAPAQEGVIYLKGQVVDLSLLNQTGATVQKELKTTPIKNRVRQELKSELKKYLK